MEVFTKISVDPNASPEIKAKAAALIKYLQQQAPESEKIVVRGLEETTAEWVNRLHRGPRTEGRE